MTGHARPPAWAVGHGQGSKCCLPCLPLPLAFHHAGPKESLCSEVSMRVLHDNLSSFSTGEKSLHSQ